MRKDVKFHLVNDTVIFDEPLSISANDRLTYNYEYDEGRMKLIPVHIYLESSTTPEEKTIEVIILLLNHLPDSNHIDIDESWDWCWEELSGDAQEEVKLARDKAYQLLSELTGKVTKEEGK